MKNRTKFLAGTAALAAFASIAVLGASLSSGSLTSRLKGDEDPLTLTVNDFALSASKVAAATSSGNPVVFAASGATNSETALVLEEGGYLVNEDKISGATDVTVTFSGALSIETSVLGSTYYSQCELESGTAVALHVTSNYVKLVAGEGGATISKVSVNYSCREATPFAAPLVEGDFAHTVAYNGEKFDLSSYHVYDEGENPCTDADMTLSVTLPDSSVEAVSMSGGTYSLDDTGAYGFTFNVAKNGETVTSSYLPVQVKEKFIVGWDDRMFRDAKWSSASTPANTNRGISGLTPTIMANYENYLLGEIEGTNYENCSLEMVSINALDDVIADTISAANPDLLVGFTSTIYGDSIGVSYLERKSGTIAECPGRFVSRSTASRLAEHLFDASSATAGFDSLKTTKINIAWFKSSSVKGATAERMEAVDEALESHLSELGYAIDVESKAYEKGSAYSDCYANVSADHCAFGLDWGSNANKQNAFGFGCALVSGFTFGSDASRYVLDFMNTNGTLYTFYDDIFTYLQSDTMKAVYAA